MEELLYNPNVAYLVLMIAFLLTLMAILTPGTIILEITALIAILLSGWLIINLPYSLNYWALILLVLGVIFFFLAIRREGQVLFLVLSIASLILGSTFLFLGDEWWPPVVNPGLTIVVSGLSAVFLWVVTRKVVEAREVAPVHDLESLVGSIGEARTVIHNEGSVQVAGELWTARSDQPIRPGTKVMITERDGFILIVEPVPEDNES